MSTIEQRLERLERTNHRFLWIIGGLLLLAGVVAAQQPDLDFHRVDHAE